MTEFTAYVWLDNNPDDNDIAILPDDASVSGRTFPVRLFFGRQIGFCMLRRDDKGILANITTFDYDEGIDPEVAELLTPAIAGMSSGYHDGIDGKPTHFITVWDVSLVDENVDRRVRSLRIQKADAAQGVSDGAVQPDTVPASTDYEESR